MKKLERELLAIIKRKSPVFEIEILKLYDVKPSRRRDEMKLESISNALCELHDAGFIGLDLKERWIVEAKS